MSRASVIAIVCTFACFSAAASPADAAENPIALENARQADKLWEFGDAAADQIEGYTSDVSIAPGQTIEFHVKAPAARYRIEVYRFGWYQSGFGRVRKMGCVPSCQGSRGPTPQPDAAAPDAETGEVDAGWSVTDKLKTGTDWVSGYYTARFRLTSGPDAGKSREYPFVVRARRPDRSHILVIAPVNTWAAYNNWGGKSLYTDASTDHVAASHVSFNRPRSLSLFLNYEYQIVRFVERLGYDVSYATDVDVDRDPSLLQGHRAIISAGHGEYWTMGERNAFDAARDRGQNLVFLGSDTATWQVRYENDRRTLVGYKSKRDPVEDPQLETIRFRDLPTPRPECELMGVQRMNGKRADDDPPRDYTVTDSGAAHPWFSGTGLQAGDVLPDLVGHEWDVYLPECRQATVLLHYEGSPSNADAVTYTAPSGARVLSTGSLYFNWALDAWGGHRLPDDPRLQSLIRNALDDLAPGSRPLDARPGAPRLALLHWRPRAIRVGRRSTPLAVARKRPPRGARIRYSVSEPSRAVFRLDRLRGDRSVTIATFVRGAKRGTNAFRFTGRIRRKALPPGRYMFTVSAVDAGSNSSPERRAGFTITRP